MIACEQQTCTACGEETAVVGYDESEQLDCEPARYFVRVTRREKRACQKCSTIEAAKLPERIVEKGLASNAVVIDTVVAKYCDHFKTRRRQTAFAMYTYPMLRSSLRAMTLFVTVVLAYSQSGPNKVQPVRKTGTTDTNYLDGLTYVWIQPGTFTMG